mmetsp:Transcript_10342/g.38122  ORF Transcript_10342/g.38122 Transcript_10342/m.38122 type:complete len:128 (+) Transcript_10342:2254-2637(+)
MRCMVQVTGDILHAKLVPAAHCASRQVNAMLKKAEKELELVDQKVGEKMHLIDKDRDGKISQEELLAAISFLRDSLDQEDLDHLFSKVQRDAEGNIDLEELIGDLKGDELESLEEADQHKHTAKVSS